MDEIKWYENTPLITIKSIIKDNANTAVRSFVAIGYYLKDIRDRELYLEDGYKNIWEFAQDEFGIGKSSASRFMAINDRFSKDGNSPILMDQYKDFSSSKLSEMLTLSDEQVEQVTITTTVAEIREMKQPVKEEVVATSQQKPELIKPITIDDLELSVRTYNCLKRADIDTIEKLCELTEIEVSEVRSISRKCLDEIKLKLSEIGRGLKPDGQSKDEKPDEDIISASEHDEQWFTKQLLDRFSDELKKLMQICRTSKSRTEVAKEFQKYASAYGARSSSGPGYSFNFHNFAGGIDIKINGEEIHLKYGRLVEEALKLYNPFSSEFDEDENEVPQIVNEEPETVIKVDDSDNEQCSGCKLNGKADAGILECHPENGGHKCWIAEEEEESEIVEADVIHTKSDPEKYSIIDAEWEVKTHENNLDVLRKDNCTVPARNKTKMRLDAMLLLVTEMKKPVIEEETEQILEQPLLPILKNNDQRQEWLRKYQDWGIWYQDDNVNARYFKYDLTDGSRIVAAQYKNMRVRFHQEDGDWSLAHYHLIKAKDYFNPYESSQTEIVEHLKSVIPRK